MSRYELAVIRRACRLVFGYVSPRRVRLTADRGFADGDLFDLLNELSVRFVIRVKGCVKVCRRGRWVKLNRLGFVTRARQGLLLKPHRSVFHYDGSITVVVSQVR